jgi:hypothetical protein
MFFPKDIAARSTSRAVTRVVTRVVTRAIKIKSFKLKLIKMRFLLGNLFRYFFGS